MVHKIIGKIPVFSAKDLWSDSTHPQHGIARCEVLERAQDSLGRKVDRVTIAKPDGLESVDGLSAFVVLESQVSEDCSL
jgi:hypothetical protein